MNVAWPRGTHWALSVSTGIFAAIQSGAKSAAEQQVRDMS
jgi:hypothetical protein